MGKDNLNSDTNTNGVTGGVGPDVTQAQQGNQAIVPVNAEEVTGGAKGEGAPHNCHKGKCKRPPCHVSPCPEPGSQPEDPAIAPKPPASQPNTDKTNEA